MLYKIGIKSVITQVPLRGSLGTYDLIQKWKTNCDEKYIFNCEATSDI